MKTLPMICALCILVWSRVCAQDAAALLAESKRAAGGEAWNSVRSLSITSEGLQGGIPIVVEEHQDTKKGRYLTTYRLGTVDRPDRTENAEGYDGKTAWEQDPSGYAHAVTDAGSLRKLVNEVYLARYAYWFPERAPAKRQYVGRKPEGERAFDVVQITPEGGQSFDLWIDSSTHLIDRRVEQGPTGALTTYFSNYSQAGDLKIPFTVRYANGTPGTDVTNKVRKVQTSTADADLFFGVPPLPPPDYQLPAGQNSVTVPFQFTGNHIYVSIRINGQGPYKAAFDTGSSSFLMTPATAKGLHLTPQGALQGSGLGEKPLSMEIIEVESVQIDGITLRRPTFAVADMGELPISTVIGYEVLRRFVVGINYDAHTLTLTRPDKFVYRGKGVVLPLHLYGYLPALDGSVDGIKGLFTLDTGSGGALDLFSPFVQANDLRHKYAAGTLEVTGIGLGGVMRSRSVRIGSLRLGTAGVQKVDAELSADQSGVASDTEVAGNVGETVLSQFNLTFDYTHGQVILERNKGYGRTESGHAGLVIEPQGREWRVLEVTPNGAAAQAGIRESDRVLQVEGKDAGQLPLDALWDVFHRPVGTKLQVLVRSDGQKRLVTLTLGKAP